MRGGMKKAVKCITVTEMFFNVQLIAAFSHKVRRVALVFGASMMSPREAVIVEFLEQKAAVDGSKSSSVGSFEELETQSALLPPSREELERLCAQKLMREVFTHIMKHMDSTLPVTQLHVAVLAEQQSTSIPGFIPKQNFKLRLPKDKRHVQAHYIKIFVNTDRATRTESEEFYQISTSSEQSQCYPEEMWHVLSKPIPGFSEVIDVIEA